MAPNKTDASTDATIPCNTTTRFQKMGSWLVTVVSADCGKKSGTDPSYGHHCRRQEAARQLCPSNVHHRVDKQVNNSRKARPHWRGSGRLKNRQARSASPKNLDLSDCPEVFSFARGKQQNTCTAADSDILQIDQAGVFCFPAGGSLWAELCAISDFT